MACIPRDCIETRSLYRPGNTGSNLIALPEVDLGACIPLVGSLLVQCRSPLLILDNTGCKVIAKTEFGLSTSIPLVGSLLV